MCVISEYEAFLYRCLFRIFFKACWRYLCAGVKWKRCHFYWFSGNWAKKEVSWFISKKKTISKKRAYSFFRKSAVLSETLIGPAERQYTLKEFFGYYYCVSWTVFSVGKEKWVLFIFWTRSIEVERRDAYYSWDCSLLPFDNTLTVDFTVKCDKTNCSTFLIRALKASSQIITPFNKKKPSVTKR